MKIKIILSALVVFLATSSGYADTIEVKGKGIQFDPIFVRANVGDVVSFSNMAGHFVQSIDALIPEGAEKMLSKMGENYNYTLTKEGVYFYICPPHWGARMGAFIVAGSPANLDQILDNYENTIKQDKSLKPAKGLMKKFRKKLESGEI